MGKIANAIRGLALPQQKQTQMLYLDTEFEKLEAERDTLKLENRDLRAQVKPLEDNVKRLEAQVKELTSNKEKNVVHDELDSIEESFLSFLASVNKAHCTTKRIADVMRKHHADPQMTELKAEVYLKRLSKRDMVGLVLDMGDSRRSHWQLHSRGKEYVVLHSLQTQHLPDPGEEPDNPKGHRCDHCGSVELRRTGSRPNKDMSEMGIKDALYSCLKCGKESAFTNDEAEA